jgi:riboflavin synthase
VTSHTKSTFTALAVEETLRRTTLGKKNVGDSVNLERAMLATARFGGHVVQGHVDGVGHVESVRPEGEGWWVTIEPPFELMKYVVEKGSITIDGISLTVANVAYRRFAVVVIPHTRDVTTAGSWEKGLRVNLEVDLIAKYVERLLQWEKTEK